MLLYQSDIPILLDRANQTQCPKRTDRKIESTDASKPAWKQSTLIAWLGVLERSRRERQIKDDITRKCSSGGMFLGEWELMQMSGECLARCSIKVTGGRVFGRCIEPNGTCYSVDDWVVCCCYFVTIRHGMFLVAWQEKGSRSKSKWRRRRWMDEREKGECIESNMKREKTVRHKEKRKTW